MVPRTHRTVFTETLQARVILYCIGLIVLGVVAFAFMSMTNKNKFHKAYDAVYVGQSVSDMRRALEENGLKAVFTSADSVETSTSVGYESDLVMTIKIDELGHVSEKDAFDTGFNFFPF